MKIKLTIQKFLQLKRIVILFLIIMFIIFVITIFRIIHFGPPTIPLDSIISIIIIGIGFASIIIIPLLPIISTIHFQRSIASDYENYVMTPLCHQNTMEIIENQLKDANIKYIKIKYNLIFSNIKNIYVISIQKDTDQNNNGVNAGEIIIHDDYLPSGCKTIISFYPREPINNLSRSTFVSKISHILNTNN